MCAWAAKHKYFAFGMLMAHVRPEKFAMGACWKKKGL